MGTLGWIPVCVINCSCVSSWRYVRQVQLRIPCDDACRCLVFLTMNGSVPNCAGFSELLTRLESMATQGWREVSSTIHHNDRMKLICMLLTLPIFSCSSLHNCLRGQHCRCAACRWTQQDVSHCLCVQLSVFSLSHWMWRLWVPHIDFVSKSIPTKLWVYGQVSQWLHNYGNQVQFMCSSITTRSKNSCCDQTCVQRTHIMSLLIVTVRFYCLREVVLWLTSGFSHVHSMCLELVCFRSHLIFSNLLVEWETNTCSGLA